MLKENTNVSDNACIPQETVLNNLKLAHAYVPFQKLCATYNPVTALMRGTAFPPLYDDYVWERKGKVIYDDE